nr:hypothetical protein [uncultured Noviherbaspirillum sp.]
MAIANSADLFVHLKPHEAYSARLSGFQINMPAVEFADALLAQINDGRADGLAVRRFALAAGIESSKWAGTLVKLRKEIAAANGVAPQNLGLRRNPDKPSEYYFLATKTCRIGHLVTGVDESNARRICEVALMTLMLRDCGYLSDRFSSAVGPNGRSSRLFLLMHASKSKSKAPTYLSCLEIEIVFDSHNQIQIDAMRRVFAVSHEDDQPGSTVSAKRIGNDVTKIAWLDERACSQLDARGKIARKTIGDIDFRLTKVRATRWIGITQIVSLVEQQLQNAKVPHQALTFRATHYIKQHQIKPEQIGFPPQLCIYADASLTINSTLRNAMETQIRANVGGYGRTDISIKWLGHPVLLDGHLPEGAAYLFINRALTPAETDPDLADYEREVEAADMADTETAGINTGESELPDSDSPDETAASCLLKGKLVSPEEAYFALARSQASLLDVDTYTRAKYRNVISARAFKVCLQGIDVIESVSELLDSYKMHKALAELALKWVLTEGMFQSQVFIPNVRIKATYTRSGKMGNRIGIESVAQLKLTSLDGKGAKVSVTRVPPGDYDGINQAIRDIPLIRRVPRTTKNEATQAKKVATSSLRDATFIMEVESIDETNEETVCLLVYDGTTVKIPRIIGSEGKPLLHEQLDELIASLPPDQKNLPRSKDANLLPYYIEGLTDKRSRGDGRGDFIYIDASHPKFLRYFVPQVLPVNAALGFSRFYDIMLYRRDDVAREDPLDITVEHAAVRAFFSMMTQDVVRLGENGKHTLARKLAGLALLN